MKYHYNVPFVEIWQLIDGRGKNRTYPFDIIVFFRKLAIN